MQILCEDSQLIGYIVARLQDNQLQNQVPQPIFSQFSKPTHSPPLGHFQRCPLKLRGLKYMIIHMIDYIAIYVIVFD